MMKVTSEWLELGSGEESILKEVRRDNNVDEKYQDDFARYADEISVMLLSFVKNRFLSRK